MSEPPHESKPKKRTAPPWRIIVLAAVVIGLFVAMLIPAVRRPITGAIGAALEWTDGLGVWGPVVVAAFYVVACVLSLPGSVITIGAGFIFGVVTATITVSIGSTLGACAAFGVGRTLARKWIERKVSANARFAAIDAAVGRQGFKIVLLTRLSPIFPFNLLNYGYGLTRVRFAHYALASWVGMLPGTVMYVYVGAAAKQAAMSLTDIVGGKVKGNTATTVLFWAGLAVAVAVAVVVTRVARKALREAIEAESPAPPAEVT